MAIDYHDLTAITDTLKNVYGEGLQNQFDEAPITYNQFPKSTRKPKGKGYVFGIRNERAQGVGGRAESAKLPDPLAGKYDQATISPKYIYGSIRLTGPMIEAAKGDVAAFVDGLSDSMDDIYKSVEMDMNRQCWSDGFGLLATLSEASDSLSTSANWTVTCDNDRGMMYVRDGMLVDFYQSTAYDVSSCASRVDYVDIAAKTCEMEGNAGDYKTNHPNTTMASGITIATDTVASGSLMVKMGARDDTHATTDTPSDICGLDGLFDDGTLLATFEGITVSSAPKWQAYMLGNSDVNREINVDLMLQACDLSRRHIGGGQIEMRMGLGQRRKYANLLMPDVRFAPGVLKGGYETLTFSAGDGSVSIIIDPMAQPNKIYVSPKGLIKKYEMAPLGWGAMDQKMHQRAGYDEWDMFLRLYTNLGVEQRNPLVLIEDLVEPNIFS